MQPTAYGWGRTARTDMPTYFAFASTPLPKSSRQAKATLFEIVDDAQ
jgi:hypothetical protein